MICAVQASWTEIYSKASMRAVHGVTAKTDSIAADLSGHTAGKPKSCMRYDRLTSQRERKMKMDIKTVRDEATLILQISGRVDTKTAPQLEEIVSNSLDGVKLLIMDFEEVEYISSAGLRVLLIAQKTMNKQGDMKVNNVNTDIMEIFEVTGFSDILTIE